MQQDTDLSLPLAEVASGLTGTLLGHRLISIGDEHALMPQEVEMPNARPLIVRRASAAARIVARELLRTLGITETALPKSQSGAPIWPKGVIGSLAHDFRIAIAVVALRSEMRAIGIDIEPAGDLSTDEINIVATPREKAMIQGVPNGGKLLFVAKEATYKALHPLDDTFLEHHDIEIDFPRRKATVSKGKSRTIDLRFCLSTHIAALAFIRTEKTERLLKPLMRYQTPLTKADLLLGDY